MITEEAKALIKAARESDRKLARAEQQLANARRLNKEYEQELIQLKDEIRTLSTHIQRLQFEQTRLTVKGESIWKE